jgi:hypothetical protein
MARTPSTMLALGTPLPAFALPDVVSGQVVREATLAGKIGVFAFICNHCPFVMHLKPELAGFGRFCQAEGVSMVAISSNDVTTHPMDGPEAMAEDAKAQGYVFPYLYDETQQMPRARPTSSSSPPTGCWRTAGSSTRAGPGTACP